MQQGILVQLQFVINRKNVINEPKDNFDACEDFFCLVFFTCHILSCFIKLLGMDELNRTPNSVPDDIWLYSDQKKLASLDELSSQFIDEVINLDASLEGMSGGNGTDDCL